MKNRHSTQVSRSCWALALAAGLLGWAVESWAAGTWYLAPNGSDGDGSRAKPWKTIRFAKASKEQDPAFGITTKKAQDRVEVHTKDGAAVFTVSSPSGIGTATISPKDGRWPKKVVLRLRLKGLESLTLSNGKVVLGAAVSSHGDQGQRVYLKENDQEKPANPGSPYWTQVKVVGGKEVPLKDGYFEIEVPGRLLDDRPQSLVVNWIDFYRG